MRIEIFPGRQIRTFSVSQNTRNFMSNVSLKEFLISNRANHFSVAQGFLLGGFLNAGTLL